MKDCIKFNRKLLDEPHLAIKKSVICSDLWSCEKMLLVISLAEIECVQFRFPVSVVKVVFLRTQ
jgi:hypothetical protein